MVTDIQLGIANPLYTPGIRGVARLTEYLFYIAYMIERWCIDKIVCMFHEDFHSAQDVIDYIKEKGYPDPWEITPINPGEARRMVKCNVIFRHSISDLVIYHNQPADAIHNAMRHVWAELNYAFDATRVYNIPFPERRDKASMGARKDQYMTTSEWWDKRNAFFKVFNCCAICGKMEVSSSCFNAHHLHYDTLGAEDWWDLLPVCNTCHAVIENKNKKSN
jgi:hypothetical protein